MLWRDTGDALADLLMIALLMLVALGLACMALR